MSKPLAAKEAVKNSDIYVLEAHDCKPNTHLSPIDNVFVLNLSVRK